MSTDGRLERALESRAMEPRSTEPPVGEQGKIAINFGSQMYSVFGRLSAEETFNLNEVPIRNLLRMYNQDGQISGLYSLLRLPVVATEFHIDSKDRRGGREAEAIHQNLLEPAHSGGMSTSMRYIKGDMAMAALTGFRAYEKVFDIRGGYVVLQKLAPRNPETVTILQDKTGGFAGFKQHIPNPGPGELTDVTIDRDRSLLFTNNRESNPLWGRSDFLPAYYHYDKLHKLYYVAHMAFQALVLPPRIGTYPQSASMDTNKLNTFWEGVKQLGFDQAMMVQEGFKVEAFGTDRPGMNFLDLIEHHIGQMSKSVLAPHMDLGSGKGRGSFALSKELGEIWIMSVESKHQDIDDCFNSYVIPQLTDYNFSSRKYPVMEHDPLSNARKDALISVYTKLMASPSDHSSPEFLLTMEEELAKELEIPEIDYAAIRAQRQADIASQRAASTQKQTGAVAGLMDTLLVDREGKVSLTDKSWDLIKQLSEEHQNLIAKALLEKRLQGPPEPAGGGSGT